MVWPFQNAIYRFLECNYYCGVLPLINCKFSTIIVLGLLAFRWPFLRQPDNYLSWATSMPFASITFSWRSISESLVKTNHYSPIWRITFHWNPPIFNSEIKKKKFCFIPMKISLAFIWGIVYFCTRYSLFKIMKKTSSELLCTPLHCTTPQTCDLMKIGFSQKKVCSFINHFNPLCPALIIFLVPFIPRRSFTVSV